MKILENIRTLPAEATPRGQKHRRTSTRKNGKPVQASPNQTFVPIWGRKAVQKPELVLLCNSAFPRNLKEFKISRVEEKPA